VNPTTQRQINDRTWSRPDLVVEYDRDDLRPVETVLLSRYRDTLAGRVLELGCGAGRVTGHLAGIAAEVHAIDRSPAMVAACAAAYPSVSVGQGDIRDLSGLDKESYDAVVAAFCVIDVLDDADRRWFLDELRRVVRPDGLVIFSSHNRGCPPGGITLRGAGVLHGVARIRHLPRWLSNRRRILPAQRVEPDYAILNDIAHDWSLLHYYVTRDAQARQLDQHGFTLVECLDLDGHPVGPGELAPHSAELHYVARPR
jgi:SAM-dependent methyltransferase